MKYQIKHTYNLQFIPNRISTKHLMVLKNGPTSSNQLFQKKETPPQKRRKTIRMENKKNGKGIV